MRMLYINFSKSGVLDCLVASQLALLRLFFDCVTAGKPVPWAVFFEIQKNVLDWRLQMKSRIFVSIVLLIAIVVATFILIWRGEGLICLLFYIWLGLILSVGSILKVSAVLFSDILFNVIGVGAVGILLCLTLLFLFMLVHFLVLDNFLYRLWWCWWCYPIDLLDRLLFSWQI